MIGRTVGRYRVVDRVGRGGMGTVYRARDESLQREVAIKVLNAGLDDPDLARRFQAEAVTIARLDHPGISRIYELFEHDGQWLMAMELVPGETLERIISREGALEVERAAAIVGECLAALGHAHGLGIVHRDLKPANIMITPDASVKLMDFGLARALDSDRVTQVGFMMGTPAYMAPEQVLGEDVDPRTDLYAMGVVLYRMLTGTLPFTGDTPFAVAQAQIHTPPAPIRTVRPDIPDWMTAIVDRALAKDPADRFQSAGEFLDAVARGAQGEPIAAGAPAAHRPAAALSTALAAETARRRTADWRVATGLILIGLVVIAGAMFFSRREAPAPMPEAPLVVAPSLVPAAEPEVRDAGGGSPSEAAAPSALPRVEPQSGPAPAPVIDPPDDTGTLDELPPVEVPGIKVMVLDGREADDVDATLTFTATRAEAVGDDDGEPVASWAYDDIAGATYVHARDPRWSDEFASPPDNLDVGGMFRQSRHWLTLQNDEDFIILRLEDINIIQVVREFEARTGMVIRRPPGDADR